MTNGKKPVWFISGCSTEFGRELVLLLRDQGFRVAATARDVTKIQNLAAGHEEAMLTSSLDVTDKTAVDRAVKKQRQSSAKSTSS
jgi:NADP-dependent 3-hydroxy acid dehydrogenase YdfG